MRHPLISIPQGVEAHVVIPRYLNRLAVSANPQANACLGCIGGQRDVLQDRLGIDKNAEVLAANLYGEIVPDTGRDRDPCRLRSEHLAVPYALLLQCRCLGRALGMHHVIVHGCDAVCADVQAHRSEHALEYRVRPADSDGHHTARRNREAVAQTELLARCLA